MIQAQQLIDYSWNATIIKIHDGDTITVEVKVKRTQMKNQDIGFRFKAENRWLIFTTPIRFYGINAPELSTPEGQAALTYINTQIAVGQEIVLKTYSDPQDKYGRWLGRLYLADGSCLNDLMVSTGHAVVYNV